LDGTKVNVAGFAFEVIGDEPVDLRSRLEHFQGIHREHGIKIAADSCGIHRALEHVGDPFDKMPVLWPLSLSRRKAARASRKASSLK
jgi:hypothetical protein